MPDINDTNTPQAPQVPPEPNTGPAPDLKDKLTKGEELLAKVKQEAVLQEQNVEVPAETPKGPEVSQETKPSEGTKVPEQFQTPDGQLDEAKLAKSTQHIEEKVKQKKVTIEKYKELQREMSRLGKEQKQAEVQQPEPPSNGSPTPGIETPQASGPGQTYEKLVEEINAGLEKGNAAETILKAAGIMSDYKVGQLAQKLDKAEQMSRENRMLSQLDEVAQVNPWILTPEGQEEIGRVLKEKPYLLQGENAYLDAVAFAKPPNLGQQPAVVTPAAKPPMPILGSGNVVPPPTSAPVSDAQVLSQLSKDLVYHSRRNNRQKANEIRMQMDEIYEKERIAQNRNP